MSQNLLSAAVVIGTLRVRTAAENGDAVAISEIPDETAHEPSHLDFHSTGTGHV